MNTDVFISVAFVGGLLVGAGVVTAVIMLILKKSKK